MGAFAASAVIRTQGVMVRLVAGLTVNGAGERMTSLRALSSVAVQQVAEPATGGDQRGGHQVEGHPSDAGQVA